jgi:hypothetical protein
LIHLKTALPFTLIEGTFVPAAGTPDGDSVRFLANNNELWNTLQGRPVNISPVTGTVQLRFEGIDAIEKKAVLPFSNDATKNMFKHIGHSEQNPTPNGYILARMTDDESRRPICFVFSGNASQPDGTQIFLEADLVKESVNWKQMRDGYAYPLYYNTLFASLRAEFNKAFSLAKEDNGGLGYWPVDSTEQGVTVNSHSDLSSVPPIWPKLWRRLDEYLRDTSSLEEFIGWMENRNERIVILSIMEERGLQDIVEVDGNKVKLTEPPENLMIGAKAGLVHH